jgi:hypothetical protein
MTENIHTSVLTNLRRIALIDESYLRNLEWDDEREDVFNLTKFTNLEIAAMAIDFGKNIVGPVKLVQVTWGACPIRRCWGRNPFLFRLFHEILPRQFPLPK